MSEVRPLRVLFIHPNLKSGGAETQLLGLMEYLSREHEVHLALYDAVELRHRADLERLGIVIHELNKTTGVYSSLKAINQLREIVRRSRINVVKTYLANTNLLSSVVTWGMPEVSIVWGLRISTIASKHTNLKAWLVDKLLIRCSSRADLLISNNYSGLAEFSEKGLQPTESTVIPNGIKLSRYFDSSDRRDKARRLIGVSEDTILIGMVARRVSWKGHTVVLQALAELAGSPIDLRVVFVGDGPVDWFRRLKKIEADLGLEEKVLWLGDREDVEVLLNAFDLFTLASTSGEGHSNALVEAIATALPVVATDVGDNASIVRNDGIIVKPGSAQAVVVAWQKIISDFASARNAAKTGKCRIIAEHSEVVCHRKMEKALLGLL